MIKEIAKDVFLALVVAVVQVGTNMLYGKENDWFLIIFSSIALGTLDFIITFLKGKLESVNYTIKGITRTNKNNNMNTKKNTKKNKKK